MATEIKSARDALESIGAWAEANLRDYGCDWKLHNRLCDMLKSALAEPRKNCEVGSVKEQTTRYHQFCHRHFTPSSKGGNCDRCPLKGAYKSECRLAWAQMAYPKGDEK